MTIPCCRTTWPAASGWEPIARVAEPRWCRTSPWAQRGAEREQEGATDEDRRAAERERQASEGREDSAGRRRGGHQGVGEGRGVTHRSRSGRYPQAHLAGRDDQR